MLAAKNIKYDLVNTDLNKKPDWFFDLNPYGEVPVLLHNGGCVYSSLCVSRAAQGAHSPCSQCLFALLNNTKVLKNGNRPESGKSRQSLRGILLKRSQQESELSVPAQKKTFRPFKDIFLPCVLWKCILSKLSTQ